MRMRLFPPSDPRYSTSTAYGRTYTGVAGTPVTTSYEDGAVLAANGWSTVALSGPSADRPKYGNVTSPWQAVGGAFFFDETLNELIVFAADLVWRDPITGAAV